MAVVLLFKTTRECHRVYGSQIVKDVLKGDTQQALRRMSSYQRLRLATMSQQLFGGVAN